jgi:bifunctional non-homologous end joining protein LigD
MSGKGVVFVVHEHRARHLHYDLRLEHDGVLKSWALPRGVPEIPGEKHLAVETADHPLSYRDFSGEIPEGEYGAGTVVIWDTGPYHTISWEPEKIEFIAKGKRLQGKYVLIRFRKAGEKFWLMIRSSSEQREAESGAGA